MNKRKILTMVGVIALTAAIAIGGTMAYLTSTDTVTNTFTVGNVAITLDEAKVNTDGTPVANAERVKANEYKLMPGHIYTKDPTVHVTKGSEASYIRMLVTVTKSSELDSIFGSEGANLTNIFNDYDTDTWTYVGNTVDTTNDTRTYEFRYKEAVGAPDAVVTLPALFTGITVPGSITNNQLNSIAGMTITCVAEAIQADGFTTAAAAWAAFPTT